LIPYPKYLANAPMEAVALMNVPWITNVNDTFEVTSFVMNSIYVTSPTMFFRIFNYCHNNVTLINQSIPAFSKSMNGSSTTYDFTRNFKYDRTYNKICVYYS
jgi:hypothetical protein